MNRCFFLLLFLHESQTEHRQSKPTTWTSFSLKQLSSSVFVLCVAFESRSACFVAIVAIIGGSQSGKRSVVVEYLPSDESQSKLLVLPSHCGDFYCDRKQTRGIDFRIKLAYSLICDFLIQQFGFLNIWSGFIVVVFLFIFSVLGSQ